MNELGMKQARLRKKRTIGDWFLIVAIVLLGLMTIADLAGDNVLNKASATISKMISKVK